MIGTHHDGSEWYGEDPQLSLPLSANGLALVSFPAMTKEESLYENILTCEKLIDEYEKLSELRYDPNLKIGTLLKSISDVLKRTLFFDMDDKTCEQMKARLLEHERSSQT